MASADTPPPDCLPFLDDVRAGLAADPPQLAPKYFYDAVGSRLFDRITELDAYYPTRTERGILQDNVDAMVDAIGPDAVLIEYGSGSSDKTRILLDALAARAPLAAYVSVDISAEHLDATAADLRAAYPDLTVVPIAADYSAPIPLPDLPAHERRVVFFPGSTIGNSDPDEATAFLGRMGDAAGTDGAMLVGVDQRKDPAVLVRAYDDPEGVTAAFNRNVLRRMRDELGARLDLSGWTHQARWNADAGRIEMHLVADGPQTIAIGDDRFAFADGDSVWTESSYKYTPDGLARLAAAAGLRRTERWTDAQDWFAVELYTHE